MSHPSKRGGARVDKTTLVERDFQDGEILIKELDKAHINVHSAFWLYDSEADHWRLIIASTAADFASPKKAYTHIQNVLKSMGKTGVSVGFSLENISVISPNDPFINILNKAIKTGPKDISGIRFSRNRIGNSYIEDAYIYIEFSEFKGTVLASFSEAREPSPCSTFSSSRRMFLCPRSLFRSSRCR
jgi:hypothetical protein